MEDVLDLYERAPREAVARICFDEKPCQLLGEVTPPLPIKPGKPLREDYEYKRQGTAVILLAYDIDTGQRYTQVRERRTKKDYAQFMQWLTSTHYQHVEGIEVVQDNLNTHAYGSFYEHMPAHKARELCQKLDFHFTPKHASWLNMAEIEFSDLDRNCLQRRIDSLEKLQSQVAAWQQERNSKAVKIHWSFTVNTARETMARKYKEVNESNKF